MSVEVKILRYLARHPGAKDTAEGIAEWWMIEQPVRPSEAEVKAGLDRLVARKRMAVERSADGKIIYGARPAEKR